MTRSGSDSGLGSQMWVPCLRLYRPAVLDALSRFNEAASDCRHNKTVSPLNYSVLHDQMI